MIRIAKVLLMLSLTACTAGGRSDAVSSDKMDGPSLPKERPYIVGAVTSVQPDHILVEQDPAGRSGSAKAMLEINENTRIQQRDGAPASRSDLRVGTRVSAWIDGAVSKSYPVQAIASLLVIEP